jgi:UDP:flavonoid glycosyltransferase YjiC (YdhE family)
MLTVESLCRAIDAVMNDATMHENVAALGHRLREENGTSNAVTQWMSDR